MTNNALLGTDEGTWSKNLFDNVPLVFILEVFFKIIDHSAFEVCFKKLNKASNYDISEQQMLDCATGIEKEYL